MSNDIRLTRLKLEAIELNSKFDAETLSAINEWGINESTQLNEGILDTIKEKLAKIIPFAKSNPEALKQKVQNQEEQLRAQGKDAQVEKVNSFIERFKRNFADEQNFFTFGMSMKAIIFGLWTAGTPDLGPAAGAAVFAALNVPTAVSGLIALYKTLMGKGQVEPKQATA
jgi:hypothetical protein